MSTTIQHRVRREIVNLLVAEGFTARQIQKVIRVTDRQVLVAQLEGSLLKRCRECGTNGDHYCPADVATS